VSWTDKPDLTRYERQALIDFLTAALKQDRIKPGMIYPPDRHKLESALAKLERTR
jgi:hypothetical protein